MHRSIAVFSLLVALVGCITPGPDGKTVVVFDPTGSSCPETQQFVRNGNATVDYAQQAKVSGALSSEKLVDISQEIYLLGGRATQACEFFHKGRITFDQYRSEMEQVTAAMMQLKNSVPAPKTK